MFFPWTGREKSFTPRLYNPKNAVEPFLRRSREAQSFCKCSLSVLGKWLPKNKTLSCETRITWELANKGTWRLKQWQEYFGQGVSTVAMTGGWRTHCSVGQLWYFVLVPTLYPWTWRSLVEQVTLEGGWQWQCRDLIQSFLAQSKPHSSPTQVHQRQWFS